MRWTLLALPTLFLLAAAPAQANCGAEPMTNPDHTDAGTEPYGLGVWVMVSVPGTEIGAGYEVGVNCAATDAPAAPDPNVAVGEPTP